jgi:hypothetical protein
MSSWGCPHEDDGKCARVNHVPCDAGMKGCVLFGRFVWADERKNRGNGATPGNATEPPPEAKNKSGAS